MDAFLARQFGDAEPGRVGTGWISGVASVFLGALALGGVLCLRFPEILTSPELREIYPMDTVRGLVQGVLVTAFAAGLLSALLRTRKVLGLTGMGLVIVATLLGGAHVPVEGAVARSPYLGLDWFLLNILFTVLVFVPIERAAPLRASQGPFRPGWTADLAWFFSSHALVQVLSLLILLPAGLALGALGSTTVTAISSSLPWPVQFLLVVLVADIAQYAVHRASHSVPLLWRFHRVHHSVETMDWLAGSRLHLVDVVVTRGLVLAPIVLLGFDRSVLAAYLAFVALHAVFIHANFAPTASWLERIVVTPRFHHWHHAAQSEAVDKNFAVHLPWIDAFFGTRFLPEKDWPARYGLLGERGPERFLAQLAWPLRRRG
jgi:lathosterol oxidase